MQMQPLTRFARCARKPPSPRRGEDQKGTRFDVMISWSRLIFRERPAQSQVVVDAEGLQFRIHFVLVLPTRWPSRQGLPQVLPPVHVQIAEEDPEPRHVAHLG